MNPTPEQIMAITGIEKVRLVKELNAIRLSLPSQKGVEKLKYVKRINEIRVLLSVESSADSGDLYVDASDILKSIKSLQNYIDGELKTLSPAMRNLEISRLKVVLEFIRRRIQSTDPLTGDFSRLLISLEKAEIRTDETLLDHFYSLSSDMRLDVKSGYSEVWVDEIKSAKSEPETLAKIREVEDLQENLLRKVLEIGIKRKENAGKGNHNHVGYGEILIVDVDVLTSQQKEIEQSLASEYEEIYKRINDIGDEIKILRYEKYEQRDKKIKLANEKLTSVGETVIADLLAQSPITQEQAETWANAQIIDKSSLARLQKQGYKKEDVRKDMAEFYRISGGKLRRIDIVANGSKRANASGIGQVEGLEIHVGASFDKRVLWHELAHHLEADPAAKQAANDFLLKRREDDKVYSLASLTGNRGYRKDEGAYKDSFIHEYVGKVYRGGETEVFSMGVENLSDPIKLATMIAKDPEMAGLVIGYLKSSLSKSMKLSQKNYDAVASQNQANREESQNKYQNAVEKLAAQVTLADDGWFDNLDDESKRYLVSGQYYYLTDKDAKFVGSWGDFRVFSGKFISRKTKRKMKGFSVCNCRGFISLILSNGNDDGQGRRAFRNAPFAMLGSDLTQVKAIINIAKNELDGDLLNSAMYNLIVFNDEEQHQTDIILYANKILGVPNE